jgi:hypothetical protein
MSELNVKIQRITDIQPHSNAERLEIAYIGAWTTCIQKDVFNVGDLVVFIPPDAILPKHLHEFLGISKYCGKMPKDSEEYKQGSMRVRATNLRGVKSFGTLMMVDDVYQYIRQITNEHGIPFLPYNDLEGFDVMDLLGITKHEPPEKVLDGDAEREHVLFHKYTDIERYQNYPNAFDNFGGRVVYTEKLHGCLHADTPIEMASGYTKIISDIKIGDEITTYDMHKGLFTTTKVNGVIVRDNNLDILWLELVFDNGKKLICTECHPILTTDGWIKAGDLTENHIIL